MGKPARRKPLRPTRALSRVYEDGEMLPSSCDRCIGCAFCGVFVRENVTEQILADCSVPAGSSTVGYVPVDQACESYKLVKLHT